MHNKLFIKLANKIGPINLGNPSEFSILQLAKLDIQLTSSKSSIIYLPLPQDDPMQSQSNITKAQSTLNWELSKLLKEGLNETIPYFRSVFV